MKDLTDGTGQAAEKAGNAGIKIGAGEHVDDLLKDGLVIIQKKNGSKPN